MEFCRASCLLTLVGSVVLSVVAPGGAEAAAILNPANGHYYEHAITASGVTWDQANAAASAVIFLGIPGHLATVTSAEEQAFISMHFDFATVSGNGTFIGGFQLAGSVEPTGGWQWVTGESGPVAPNYTNWGLNEPNNLGGNEDVIEYPQNSTYLWNDIPRDFFRQSYLVEYTPQVIPEPTSLLLLGIGTLSLRRCDLRGMRRNKAWDSEAKKFCNQTV
jgi:hypothetical protein